MPISTDVNAFLRVALIPRDRSHTAGTTDDADALLAADPALRAASIFTAAVLGDADALTSHLKTDAAAATAVGGPYEWDALTHLCFSRYLQHRSDLSDGFVTCARMLLDAGASANSGFMEADHEPRGTWESVLYGAAGIAHNAALTQLLVDRGADVNDDETPYHAGETYENDALKVLVMSGRMTPTNITLMLLRKLDWHDYDGAKWLLENGADPNLSWAKSLPTLVFSMTRDNRIAIIELLLDHGTDPLARAVLPDGRTMSGIEMAARLGRGDVLALLRSRGVSIELEGAPALIAACALGDDRAVHRIRSAEPQLVSDIDRAAADLLTRFSLTGNTAGVNLLLDLGLDVNTRDTRGDGYWDIARNATPLHVAAWRGHHDLVALLLSRGASVDARDDRGRTAMHLAVKAATDSYWMERRSPESVRSLLNAGASREGVQLPSGYEEIDVLLG